MIGVVVPFVSIVAAQRLAGRDSDLRELRAVLAGVNQHVQQFSNAIMQLRHTDAFKEKLNAGRGTLPADFAATRHEQVMALGGTVTNLENDCAVIGLLLDKRGDPLGISLRNLSRIAKGYIENKGEWTPPPPDQFYAKLQQEIEKVWPELRSVWEGERGRPWWKRSPKG